MFDHYKTQVLVVSDSWFGNNGLWSRLDSGSQGDFHLLSRLRTNITLFDLPCAKERHKRKGRPKKYGRRLGSVDEYAASLWDKTNTYSVFLYGKQRDVQAYSQVVLLKTLKCPVRVVWVFRNTR